MSRTRAAAVAAAHAFWRRPARKLPSVSATDETVSAWFDRWLDYRKTKYKATDGTISRFRTWVEPSIGHRIMSEVEVETVERYVEFLDVSVNQKALSSETAKGAWHLVRGMFRDASSGKATGLRVRRDNPTMGVYGPSVKPAKVGTFVYPSELRAVLECEVVPMKHRTIYALLAYLGLRWGELIALNCSDVDLEAGLVHVCRAYSRSLRRIDTTSAVGLSSWMVFAPSGWMALGSAFPHFASSSGKANSSSMSPSPSGRKPGM